MLFIAGHVQLTNSDNVLVKPASLKRSYGYLETEEKPAFDELKHILEKGFNES